MDKTEQSKKTVLMEQIKEGLNMDNLFKALLIIILVAFLYLYYENSCLVCGQ